MDKNVFAKKISARLNRALGQVKAIGSMIENDDYCIHIIRQIRAAKSALNALELLLLNRHMQTCVRTAFQHEDPVTSEEKIDEIISLLKEARKS